jgi:hypothetical protein
LLLPQAVRSELEAESVLVQPQERLVLLWQAQPQVPAPWERSWDRLARQPGLRGPHESPELLAWLQEPQALQEQPVSPRKAPPCEPAEALPPEQVSSGRLSPPLPLLLFPP